LSHLVTKGHRYDELSRNWQSSFVNQIQKHGRMK
jgi:hypothetical protein